MEFSTFTARTVCFALPISDFPGGCPRARSNAAMWYPQASVGLRGTAWGAMGLGLQVLLHPRTREPTKMPGEHSISIAARC